MSYKIDESKQLGFYFDQTRCGACNACTVACKDWNQVNPGKAAWRKQFTYELADGFFPLAFGCNHCDEPACAAICSAGAITKDANGIVTVNRDKCQQLEMCVTACPFAKPQIADDKQEPNPHVSWRVSHPMQKCTFCTDRLAAGMEPACVASCVGRALDFGTVEYIKQKYPDAKRLNYGDFPYAFVNNQNDTGPNLFINPIAKQNTAGGMVIHKSGSYTGKRQD